MHHMDLFLLLVMRRNNGINHEQYITGILNNRDHRADNVDKPRMYQSQKAICHHHHPLMLPL